MFVFFAKPCVDTDLVTKLQTENVYTICILHTTQIIPVLSVEKIIILLLVNIIKS